ncbi:MAG: ATP synthase F1 subunit delta [Bdellovibrionales bacterium]
MPAQPARTEDVAIESVSRASARVEDRYALALYELAAEQHVLPAIEHDMAALRETIAASADLRRSLEHPLIDRATQTKVLKQLAAKLQLNALTQKFLSLVAGKKRQNALEDIIAAFEAECAARRGERTAEVRSAAPLSPAQQDELARVLSAKHNATIKLNVTVDPTLLGGMQIKIGATLYDRTLKSQLTLLQHQLEAAA